MPGGWIWKTRWKIRESSKNSDLYRVFFNVNAMFDFVNSFILQLSSHVTPHFVPEIIRIDHVSKKSMP